MTRTSSNLAVFTVLAAMALMLVLPSVASAAPTNDNFADAQTISGQMVSMDGTNLGATLESGEPTWVTGWPLYDLTSHTVWYRWTAHFSGPVRIDTCTSNFDTALGIYTGNALDSLAREIGGDEGCSSGHGTELRFRATEGTTYQIQVGSWHSEDVDVGEQGTFTLAVYRTQFIDCRRDQEVCEGTEADDRITGTRAKDTIKVYGGEDRIFARGGNDVAIGGADPDKIYGNNGEDRLYGGDGEDYIYTGGLDEDRDTVNCGDGWDIVWRERKVDKVADDCEYVTDYSSGGGGGY